MGMAASTAEDGKAGGRGSESTDGEVEVEEVEVECGEKAYMRTSSKTGHWSGGGRRGSSKAVGAAKSKGSMAEGDGTRPFRDVGFISDSLS